MDQVKVIINGDDFGASPEVNEAIVRAFRAGTLTSCSLMVTGQAFGDAVRLARENEGLAVGLHLVTVHGRAVLPPEEIPLLVDREGRFSDNPTHAGLKYYFMRSARQQLTRELAAQFERFHATGLQLSHVDSHLHMHVHPVIFALALRLAESCGVRRMRVPRDDFRVAAQFMKANLAAGAITTLIFRMLSRHMTKRLQRRGFSYPDRVFGHLLSGNMTLDYVLFLLDNLSAGTYEIYFHPAVDVGITRLDYGIEEQKREFELLTSEVFRERLQRPEIKLINYFGLIAGL